MLLEEILTKITKNQNNVAYTVGENQYTYKEFYKYVCNIYRVLLIKNSSKRPVIVYGSKEIFMKATFLACSFAGMAYVPIDIGMTENRINSIIEQVKPELIIGNLKSNIKNISRNEIEKIMNEENYIDINKIYLQPDDIFYIIFTSGSTGLPKGVKVTYRNLESCIEWLKYITKIEKGVILNQASFSFDLSVADLYLSLVSGSNHYILEKQEQLNFKLLFEKLNKSKATLAVMTPSFADLLLLDKSFNENLLPNLKTILFCGEKLLKTTVSKLYERFKNLEIINSYGPTECTFAVTSIALTKKILKENNIPIGIPKKDVEIYIVDDKLNKLKDGKVGEILIVGQSVADGYIGESKNSFIKYNGKNAYLTGDLGYKKEKMIYYQCRKDNQIKYKGYRIELADIESNLLHLNYIEKAVVIPKISESGKVTKIIAFVKLKENIEKKELEIRKELLNKIPEYMCPTIKIIDKFPLNKNGKCDTKKLIEGV